MTSEDPGWSGALRAGLALLLPQAAMRRARKTGDRVVAIRMVWLSFVVLHALAGTLILAWMGAADLEENISPTLGATGVAAVALGASYARWRAGSRDLDCTEGTRLADTYYLRFMRECSIASVIMPWGIVVGLFAGSALAYGIGLVVGLVNLVAMAPVQARIYGQGQQLAARGCTVDLMAVLRSGGKQGGPRRTKRKKGR